MINEIPRALFVILYILLIALSFIFACAQSPTNLTPSTDSCFHPSAVCFALPQSRPLALSPGSAVLGFVGAVEG